MAGQNYTIVDRVVERLKLQPLGDLITEEDLHDIVKEAIPKVFFEKRRIPDPRGYSGHTELDPLIVETMRGLLKESAAVAVREWLASNSDLVAGTWKTVIDAGLLNYVTALQNEQATGQIRNALIPLFKQINEDRMRVGQPMLVL